MVMTVLFATVVTLIVMTAAVIAGKVSISAGQMLMLGAILIPGSLPFCALGLLVGSWAGARSAPAFVNLIYLPMIYLSGFLIPLPKSIDAIQLVSPAYHLDQLALQAVGARAGGTMIHLAVLVTVTVLCAFLALRRLARGE
jgi:ABC-2 type transport system permease protein